MSLKATLLERYEAIQLSSQRPHLHPRRSCCSDRFEVTDDKSYEVSAHFYRCIKPVLKEAIVYFHCLHLKYTNN